MISIGMSVRIIYPDYAKDIKGIIEAKEKNGRWLVRLEENSPNYQLKSILLSLEELEFEIMTE